jgi:hypothetical protein
LASLKLVCHVAAASMVLVDPTSFSLTMADFVL